MKDFFQSNLFKGIIITIAAAAVLIFIFGLGVDVGIKRAEYSFRWADQYHRNFGGPRGGLFGDFTGAENSLPNSNGSFGQILKINNNILTIKDADGDNTEKTILVGGKTVIIYQKKNIKISDLSVGENIVVVGDPDNNGQIQAELIRVLPASSATHLPVNNPQAAPSPAGSSPVSPAGGANTL